MSDAPSGGERWKWWAEFLTPTGIVVGLLYYFGYVTTDAWFRYFGLDLGQVQLPQQSIVLQSVAALYLPVAALLALGLAVYSVRRTTDALLASRWRPRVVYAAALLGVLVGAALLVRALVGVFDPEVSRSETIAMSPLSLCAGVLLVAGGIRAAGRARRPGCTPNRSLWSTLLVGGLVVLGLFWATNSVAGAYGRGRATDFARTLPDRPAVVVDTRERLFLVASDVEESALKTAADADYRYRYRNLRLLAASEGRLYLVPAGWRRGAGTVVVLPGDAVRLQFLR